LLRDLVELPAHEALDGEHGVLRVRDLLPPRRSADEPLSVLRERHDRRRRPAALGIRDHGRLAALEDGHARVRRAQVDTDRLCHTYSSPSVRKSEPDRIRYRRGRYAIVPAVDQETRQDLEATVAARRELGPNHEDELIAGFLERLERRVGRPAEDEKALKRRRAHQKEMTLGGMAISIPLLAIAGGIAGLWGIVAVCAALAVIAVASRR